MTIPDAINLGFVSFPTYYILVVLLIVVGLFLIWLESSKDGFDSEKIFDLFFTFLILIFATNYYLSYYAPYNLFIGMHDTELLIIGTSVVMAILARFFSKRWRWSIYRTLDIFSLFYFVFFSYKFLEKLNSEFNSAAQIALFIYIVGYLIAFFRRNKMLSGLTFSIFLLLTSIVGQFFYNTQPYLIFYFILITISMVNLFFRTKRTMISGKFDLKFLKNIKDLLKKKESRLKVEQQKLIEEDPYMQEGRDVGNAEAIDEAILEDLAKEESDIKKDNIEEMQEQVDKALEKLDSGEYGVCEVCGEKIDKARLEAYPEATTCVKCASKVDA